MALFQKTIIPNRLQEKPYADRYGPALPLVVEMMQKIEDLQSAEAD